MLSLLRGARFVTAFAAALVTTSASAQTWPSRPLSIVAPSSAGSTPDVLTRLLAQRLSEALGQQMVVVNRVGAGGNVGSESVAKAAPDGYTLLLGSIANTINPHLMQNAGFTLDDLAPVSSFAAAPDILTVHPTVTAKNLAELLAWLRQNPGTSIAIPGFGTTPHLSTEMLKAMGNVQLNVVPYQGGGAVLQGLLANQVPLAFATSVSVIPRIKGGQLRAIGVTSRQPLSSLPEVPPMAASGLPGFEITAWFGVFAPAKTPRPVIDRLADETRRALADGEMRKRLADLGAEPLGSTPAEFASFVAAEHAKWGTLIRDANIKIQ